MDRPLIQIDGIVRPMNDEEFAAWLASEPERKAETANNVRVERNNRLADCDWTQLPDAPVNSTAWAAYRQQLRDISAQTGFPWEVQWPEKPA